MTKLERDRKDLIHRLPLEIERSAVQREAGNENGKYPRR